MKTIILFLIAIQVFSSAFLFSQEIPNAINYHSKITNTSRTDGKTESFSTGNFYDRGKVLELENRIAEIRKSSNPDFSEIENLQKQIAGITGENFVMKSGYYSGQVRPADMMEQFIAAGNSRLLTKSSIKGLATATEYTGATAGKIWAVAGFQGAGSGSSPDTLMVFYSTDFGTSWISYAVITLAGTDKINYGEIDAELIEGGTNKYLHIVFGLRANGGSGKWFTAGASIRLTGSFAGSTWSLNWPGDDATKRYYCPRITSDNFVWPTSPWAYVVASFDSAGVTGRVNTQKFAQLNSPNTTTPVFSYKTSKIYWYSETPTVQYLYSDIAFYQRGGRDSVIISYCGVSDSTKVFFSKMYTSGMVSPSTAGQYIGPIGGSEPNYMKYGGKLSTNGNNNGSVFFIFNQKSATTDGVKYFRTTNYGDFNDLSQSVTWTAPLGVSFADIAGVRGGHTHRFGFFLRNAGSDSLKYISVNPSGTFLTVSGKMNYISTATGTFSPAVGMSFRPGDSCFVLYASYVPSEVWSASGCTGIITGITERKIPVKYSLSQNYPNPFNPVTKISYSLVKTQFVTLKIYSTAGKEVATLVNERKSGGDYEVTFNTEGLSSGIYFYRITAGDFSDTKKMVLVK
ncbi:MAG: T9SS type A sorting domain-containing protein [Ignavibacteriae bacterium]|nr:T9SS type A sorting domain-containing protein [Ignavibacteriota bacterium]